MHLKQFCGAGRIVALNEHTPTVIRVEMVSSTSEILVKVFFLVGNPRTRWHGSGGEWGENVLSLSYWQPSQSAHARGQLRKCQAILVIHSSWGDKVFFRPTWLWHTHTPTHPHISLSPEINKTNSMTIRVSPEGLIRKKGRCPDFKNS